MEIARGTTGDRPWPELFATLAFAGETCELVVEVGAQVHRVAFADHAVIAASSPLAADSALRLMLTSGVITPQMVPMVTARVAAAPQTDPIEVLAAVAQLPPETTLLIRRRAIAVAATRVFALANGSYHATHTLTLPIWPGAAIDVRALIYEGVRTRLSDEQLAEAVARHGTSFVLRPEIWEDLPQFGFSPAELPMVDDLRGGATIADLALRYPEIGARGVHAVATALLAARALDPLPQLPRASNQYAAQQMARASDQLPAQRISDRLPAQRTTGQFSTQAPVTGRFAARSGTTGTFDVPVVAPLDLAEPLELAAPAPRARATSPSGTYELAEQPRSRTSATFAAVEPPREDPTPPRSFTTRPPVTGAFTAQRTTGSHAAIDAPPPEIRTTGEFSVTLRPARPPTVDGDSAGTHFERGVALLDRDLPAAIAELQTAARMSGDVDHEAMLAWAQFCAAPDKEAIAKATKAALAKAVYQSPKPALAHFYLGRMERMLGRDREALAQFKTVVEQVPRHAEALAEIRMLESRLSPKKK